MKPKFKKGDKVRTIKRLSRVYSFKAIEGIVFTKRMVVSCATIREQTNIGTFTVDENPYYYSPAMLTKIK